MAKSTDKCESAFILNNNGYKNADMRQTQVLIVGNVTAWRVRKRFFIFFSLESKKRVLINHYFLISQDSHHYNCYCYRKNLKVYG